MTIHFRQWDANGIQPVILSCDAVKKNYKKMPRTSALDASSTVGPLPIDRPKSITSPGTTSFSCILLRPFDIKALEALRIYKGIKAILSHSGRTTR